MPRLARTVVPDFPHHVTQRGNRRQQTFFGDHDYLLYTALMAEWCHRCRVEIWAYCLMPNHAHLIAVPTTPDGLRRAIGEAHRRYTLEVNRREGWRGHLWQGRFASFVMDDRYTLAAARYVELNPVRAGLVARAGDYPWSSATEGSSGRGCPFLGQGAEEDVTDQLRKHESTGRPLGSDAFVDYLEGLLQRALRPLRSGPAPKSRNQGIAA